MRKLGIAVMVLGVFVLCSGLAVVASFPWGYMDLGDIGSSYQPSPGSSILLSPLLQTLRWFMYAFLALIGNLFLSGVALIITGYALHKSPTEKPETKTFP